MRFDASDGLRSRAHRLIPGGCHAYAKGDSEYPQLSPGFIARGEGGRVWDVDGNEFIEYAAGNRSVSLGHAYPAVVSAVQNELARGVNFTRPAEIEVRAAECLAGVLPTDVMVKFCKNGSDATTAAIRLARAATGRDTIAYCRDHPFFSSDDWFIATTPMHGGVPAGVKDLSVPFSYNDPEGLARLLSDHRGLIAAVILEPARYDEPRDDFLAKLRQMCDDHGVVLIFDEMITGFRWHIAGGQAVYGVEPDLACWGKAMANGFSVSALTGKRRLMEPAVEPRPFLLSTTHGGETHSLAAAIATIETYKSRPVIETLYARGEQLAQGCRRLIQDHRLSPYFQIVGRPCCLAYQTRDASGDLSTPMRALFLQETIRRGILISSMVVSYSHSPQDIDQTLAAIDGALGVYARAIQDGPDRYLVGPSPVPIYRR
jgi:glutamate-1-semialdehyde 2,1-aminomutase